MAMKPIPVGKARGSNGTNDMLPVRGQDNHYISSEYDSSAQKGSQRDIFLTNAYNMVTKLENGDQPEKKADRIEKATRNLKNYFECGGKDNMKFSIQVSRTETVEITAAQLQARLEKYLSQQK